ncbi:MAG: response regulator, partial [Desulfonatronovibrio sp. MSAO_Bac4]
MYLSGLTVNKVLIADDCELNRQLLTFFLEKLNINVMSASNGLEALELTKK